MGKHLRPGLLRREDQLLLLAARHIDVHQMMSTTHFVLTGIRTTPLGSWLETDLLPLRWECDRGSCRTGFPAGRGHACVQHWQGGCEPPNFGRDELTRFGVLPLTMRTESRGPERGS